MVLWAFDLEAAMDWAAGKIKMWLAQQKILSCHALSYPIYDLTSIIYKYGIENCFKTVEERKQEYINRLLYWNEHLNEYKGEWAEFMLK